MTFRERRLYPHSGKKVDTGLNMLRFLTFEGLGMQIIHAETQSKKKKGKLLDGAKD